MPLPSSLATHIKRRQCGIERQALGSGSNLSEGPPSAALSSPCICRALAANLLSTSPTDLLSCSLQCLFFIYRCFPCGPSRMNTLQANVCFRVCVLRPNTLQWLPGGPTKYTLQCGCGAVSPTGHRAVAKSYPDIGQRKSDLLSAQQETSPGVNCDGPTREGNALLCKCLGVQVSGEQSL